MLRGAWWLETRTAPPLALAVHRAFLNLEVRRGPQAGALVPIAHSPSWATLSQWPQQSAGPSILGKEESFWGGLRPHPARSLWDLHGHLYEGFEQPGSPASITALGCLLWPACCGLRLHQAAVARGVGALESSCGLQRASLWKAGASGGCLHKHA